MTWTCIGPWIPNLSLMWPAKPKQLPTPVWPTGYENGKLALLQVVTCIYEWLYLILQKLLTILLCLMNMLRDHFSNWLLSNQLLFKNLGNESSFTEHFLFKSSDIEWSENPTKMARFLGTLMTGRCSWLIVVKKVLSYLIFFNFNLFLSL